MTNDATNNDAATNPLIDGCSPPVADSASAPGLRWGNGRTIGPWGTTARAVAGVAAMAAGVAMPHEHPLLDLPGAGSNVLGLLIGLVATPVALTAAIWACGRNAPRLHLGYGAACLVTLVTVGVAQFYPVAVLVSIGAPLVLLAAIGRNGCELLAVPNLVLRRDDYLFCLPFSPIDRWERRRHHTSGRSSISSDARSSVAGRRG